MIHELPTSLVTWAEAPRARALNDAAIRSGKGYVLCWLQQALRARDNPVIDAAIRLGNALGLPVLVYHGLREDYPFASDRLHRFILGGSRDVAIGGTTQAALTANTRVPVLAATRSDCHCATNAG